MRMSALKIPPLAGRRSFTFILILLTSGCILTYLSYDRIRPSWLVLTPDPVAVRNGSPVSDLPSLNTDTSTDSPTPNSSTILLVSAFFPLSKSKHTMTEYSYWLSRFLGPIKSDIYFFAPPDMAQIVLDARGDLPMTLNTSYSSPFDIPPLKGLEDKYAEMHNIDREKQRHSPELYAVWAGKPFFLDEGLRNAQAEGKTYEYAFWNDAGSFRADHKYAEWPSRERVDAVWREGAQLNDASEDELIFFPIWDTPDPSMEYWTEVMGPVDNEFSEGSFFGGRPSAITWWRKLYYAYHDSYLSQGIFVGKDQTLINALFLLHPSRIITVWFADPHAPNHSLTSKGWSWWDNGEGLLGRCGPTWYYYQWWLAGDAEREAMRQVWGGKKWWWWGSGKDEEKCRDTRVLGMKGLLRREFGESWNPPSPSILAV
ncbi:hypothetical protein OE88DRAFT_1680547 [Heliocybe sulcata]|uniref:Uncharacterized protein n=1 Tax=Heliocybe sulcata TaxID=5364 RepID=A0A5C3N3S5_9AGAM|nr:hypothetical protein OE88DRAFT_1680547 [Heliocybe sulcata]